MALTGWPFIARLTRAATLQVVKSAYVELARAQGEGAVSILAREILPNVAGPLLANAGLFLVGSLAISANLLVDRLARRLTQ